MVTTGALVKPVSQLLADIVNRLMFFVGRERIFWSTLSQCAVNKSENKTLRLYPLSFHESGHGIFFNRYADVLLNQY